MRESCRPRNLTNIPCGGKPVNERIPQNFHEISTLGKRRKSDKVAKCQCGKVRRGLALSPCHLLTLPLETCFVSTRNSMAFRFADRVFDARFWTHARAEDRKLRKELAFGGPCFEGTLRKPLFLLGFRIQSRGRDNLRAKPPIHLRCRTRTRVAEKRPTSHTNALGELFIPEEGQRAQAGNLERVRRFTEMVRSS